MNKKNLYSSILVILIVGVLSFFAGMKYQESKSGRFANQQSGFNMIRQGKGQSMFRPTAGEIINADEKSITVKLPDGSTKLVLLSDKTQINKAEKATKDDLKTGVQVAVFGTTNTDGGVITAQNIQLNPQMRRNQPN